VVVLPLALLVPGYGLLSAAFRPCARLDPAPAAALSFMLSIALYPLLALILYAAGLRLSPWNTVAAVDTLMLVLAAVVVARARRARGRAGPWVPARPSGPSVHSAWSGPSGALRFVGAVTAVVIAVVVVVRTVPSPGDPPYTEFHLHGRWAYVDSVIRTRPNRRLAVDLEVVNRTHRSETYRIVPLPSGAPPWADRRVTLPPGGRWTGSVTGAVAASKCPKRLAIGLDQVGTGRSPDSVLTVWVQSHPPRPRNCPAA
jgi:uncharacterized membrane protein